MRRRVRETGRERRRAAARAGAALLAAALSAAACGSAAAGFAFAALGDAPYTREEEARFPELVAEMNREPLAFVVHLGDLKSAWSECSDAVYFERREWFALSRHPLIYVPGDNDWLDCARPLGARREPLERLARLRELFFARAASLGQRTIALERQSDTTRGVHDYPEHARWEYRGVLFVTLNAPGPINNAREPAEFEPRSAAIHDWLGRAFALARARGLRAVVVLMHANPLRAAGQPRRGFEAIVAQLAAESRRFDGEVLLVHGDTHRYRVDRPLRDPADGTPLANVLRVEVFGSPALAWVRIRVREEGGRVLFEPAPGP